jgi:hypothetical protein
MRIERYLRELQLARSQFRHRDLQPNAADVAVRRDTHGECKLTRKMKWAISRDSSKIYKSDVILDVCRNIVENTAEPNMIETMLGSVGGRTCPGIAILLKESGRKRQRGGFDLHAACGRPGCKLGED